MLEWRYVDSEKKFYCCIIPGIANTDELYTQVTKAIYSRLYIRLRVTIRMALAGIIHNRSLTIKDGIFEDSAAMTIVGSDTETAEGVGETIHNLWADLAEFCVGMYLLYRELGWVFICPLLVILCKCRQNWRLETYRAPKLTFTSRYFQKRTVPHLQPLRLSQILCHGDPDARPGDKRQARCNQKHQNDGPCRCDGGQSSGGTKARDEAIRCPLQAPNCIHRQW